MTERQARDLTESFTGLTANLMVLHRQALRETTEGASVGEEIRRGIFDAMRVAFVEDDNPVKVFNYIMYLVDLLCRAENLHSQAERYTKAVAVLTAEFASTLGMDVTIQAPPAAAQDTGGTDIHG